MNSLPTFDQLLAVENEKALKDLGKIKDGKRAIGVNGIRKILYQGLFIESFKLKGRNSYANLFNYIQKLANKFNISDDDPHDGLFKSRAAKYVFALTQADTQLRRSLLGVESNLYRDQEKAKSWRNNIAMLIHPDKCSIPDAHLAFDKLDELYKSMTSE